MPFKKKNKKREENLEYIYVLTTKVQVYIPPQQLSNNDNKPKKIITVEYLSKIY